MMNNVKKKMDYPAITLIKWHGTSPSLQELKQEILKLWPEKMKNIQYLRNLVKSMPCRLQDVLVGDGGCTYKIVLNYTRNIIYLHF